MTPLVYCIVKENAKSPGLAYKARFDTTSHWVLCLITDFVVSKMAKRHDSAQCLEIHSDET